MFPKPPVYRKFDSLEPTDSEFFDKLGMNHDLISHMEITRLHRVSYRGVRKVGYPPIPPRCLDLIICIINIITLNGILYNHS